MASPKTISLTNLFNLYTNSPRAVVVKNISAKTSRDTLVNYLTGTLNADVNELHYPADVNGCCVTVFNRPIRDLGKFERHLHQQPLDGHILGLSYLGQCDGLLIRYPPSELCPTALDMCLRSEEFTGVNEESVKDIEYISYGRGIFVVVQVLDTAVTSRILNRFKQPKCQSHDLDIDPYFPNIHDVLRELGSRGMPCLGPVICETDGTDENNRTPKKDHIKKGAAACIYQRDGSTEHETDGLSDVSTGTDGIKNGSSPKTEADRLEVSLSDKEESIEDTECDFIKNEGSFIETVKVVTQESTCKRTVLDYDNINIPAAQTEPPSSEPNSSNTLSSSKPDDDFQRKGTADCDSQLVPITGHSCQPPAEMLEESVKKPLSERGRFHQLAQELQYGLTEKEAIEQALQLSLSDDNNSRLTKETCRSGSEDPCSNDEKFHLGKDIQNQGCPEILQKHFRPLYQKRIGIIITDSHFSIFVCNSWVTTVIQVLDDANFAVTVCEQVGGVKTAHGVVMRKPFKKEIRKDLARAPSSDDARKSSSEPDLLQFDRNRAKIQRHGMPSKGRNSIPDIEIHRLQKLEQEAADEAIAKSIADQEKQQFLFRRHQADQFSKERPHSAEANYRSSKTRHGLTSALVQGERSPFVKLGNHIKDKVSDIKQAVQRTTNKIRTPADQYTGIESLAMNDMSKDVKETSVFRQDLAKHETISDGARAKIRNILIKQHVKSNEIPGMKKFVLEGDKESVVRAYEEILQILFSDDNKYEAGPTLHKHVGARRDICEYMALKDDPKVPTYWKNFNPGSSLTDVLKSLDQTVQPSMKKDHIRVELDSGDPVFKAIENIIQSTWDEQKVGHGKDAVGLDELGYRRIRIKKIHRIENLQLYERYARHRNRTFLKIHRDGRKRCKSIETIPNSWGPVMTCDLLGCPDLRREFFPEINEYFFFHGTSRDVIDAICNTGIDFRVGSQNAMYGAGIYGAESSTKADQYVDSPSQRGKTDRQMLLVRMILGDSYLCSDQNPYKYRRPPCANMKHLRDDCTDSSHGSFDSVIGQSRMFREFVVYEKDQCYPEYLITYNRK